MNKFYNSKFFNSPYLYLLIIVIYSFCINFYYGNLGVYPIDTFLHYDSAYRILKNEFPKVKISYADKEKFMPERGTLNIENAKKK